MSKENCFECGGILLEENSKDTIWKDCRALAKQEITEDQFLKFIIFNKEKGDPNNDNDIKALADFEISNLFNNIDKEKDGKLIFKKINKDLFGEMSFKITISSKRIEQITANAIISSIDMGKKLEGNEYISVCINDKGVEKKFDTEHCTNCGTENNQHLSSSSWDECEGISEKEIKENQLLSFVIFKKVDTNIQTEAQADFDFGDLFDHLEKEKSTNIQLLKNDILFSQLNFTITLVSTEFT